MDITRRERVTKVSGADVAHERWNLSTVSRGSFAPALPPPFAAACFSRRRGRLKANGLHLSLPLELSKGLGPPQHDTNAARYLRGLLTMEDERNYANIERRVAGGDGRAQVSKVQRYISRHWFIYLLALPAVLYTFIFKYVPMYGLLIAFKDYKIRTGILRSPWVGLENFRVIIQDAYFYKVLTNTLLINAYNLVFGFTFIIFLALMINELRSGWLKRAVQTVVYLPHFVSWVVFAGLVMVALEPTKEGIVNGVITRFGHEPIHFLVRRELFRGILVASQTVKEAGFATIIFLAALASVNPELMESAVMDGAHRGHMIWHIYLPRIVPTIAVLLILQVARMFTSNFDQVWNLYNPAVYETGDVLSTYLYRSGLLQGQFEMATALGLIFALVGFLTVVITNKIISRMNVMGIF
jgi:putative aldouronate transport system permease protein